MIDAALILKVCMFYKTTTNGKFEACCVLFLCTLRAYR